MLRHVQFVHTVGEAQKTHHALAVTTPATCEQAGKIVYTCEYCNEKLSEEAIPALGHDYSNWNQIGAEQKIVNVKLSNIIQEHVHYVITKNPMMTF